MDRKVLDRRVLNCIARRIRTGAWDVGSHPGECGEDNGAIGGEKSFEAARAVVEQCRQMGISILRSDEPGYPENLLSISDCPDILFVSGSLLPQDRVAVAVVGTRSPTPVGKLVAFEISRELARAGVTVVSGLAAGIDAKAHEGAISCGGRTIACLGSGPDVPYPASNRQLMEAVKEHGALLSEYPPGTGPRPWHFPARNRIISGLSLGVVVVEAGERSGALITAEWALKHGRPVMAVPGSVKSPKSSGTNRLIQDGAYLVTSARDVLSFLKRESEYIPDLDTEPSSMNLSLEESALLNAMGQGAATIDELCAKLREMPPARLMAVASALEIKGLIARIAGGKYVATMSNNAHREAGEING